MKTEMDNTGFTKGTWSIGKHNEIRSINGTMVAIVLEHVPDTMIEANAKLIASAPSMYELIVELKTIFDSILMPNESELKELSEKCQQTINKATL